MLLVLKSGIIEIKIFIRRSVLFGQLSDATLVNIDRSLIF